jgi:putative peptidoglycan lipid II flippase
MRPQGGGPILEHVSRNLRVVSLCTVLSRVLGLVRDSALAASFGTGPILDAFTLAFRIPNLARALLGEGAVATAFLPVLVAEIEHSGREAASRLISALFLTLAVLLCGLIGVTELALWWLGSVTTLSPEAELLRRLTAVLLPYVVLICLAAQVSTVLHASQQFLWPALIPVVLNLAWLLSLWCVVPWWTDPVAQVTAMSVCVLIAGGLQLAFPLPAVWRLGYRPRSDWRSALPRVGEIFRHVAPVVLGLSITHLNVLLDSAIAWGLSQPTSGPNAIAWLGGTPYPLAAGATSALYLGQRMYQFPVGVFGVALGTVLYPLFSAHAQRGDWPQLRADFALGLRLVAAIGLPASAGLVLLAEPIATGFFQYGRFDAADTAQTAPIIAAYGLGVWAYCGLLIVQRGFYALGDRITPLQVGLVAVLLNVALNLTLIWWLGGVGLAASTALVSMLQCVATGWLLQRRLGGLDLKSVGLTVGKALGATVLMYAAGRFTLAALSLGDGLGGRGMRILVPLAVSLGVYFAVAAVVRLREPWELVRLTRRRGEAP